VLNAWIIYQPVRLLFAIAFALSSGFLGFPCFGAVEAVIGKAAARSIYRIKTLIAAVFAFVDIPAIGLISGVKSGFGEAFLNGVRGGACATG